MAMAGGKQWKEKVSHAAYAPSVFYLANTKWHKESVDTLQSKTYDGMHKATLFLK